MDQLDGFTGEVVRPGDCGYDAARIVWNGMIDRRPALIVRPESREDVAAAVRFARERGLVIAVRGGGHSIPGLSTCDGGIVIDLSRLGGAHVDPHTRTARVGGGALLGALDEAALAHGLVCPVGVVSHTGVGGLTLGGGMGRLQRRFGLTIDNLLAVELVTADGRCVRASADDEPELLWGLRGAGANFGIVTAFEFRLHEFDGMVTFGVVREPAERAPELAERFRELVEDGPDTVWASFGVAAGRRVSLMVLNSGPPLPGLELQPTSYLTTQRMNDEATAWGHRFSMRSDFLRELPDSLVSAWIERVERAPADGGYSVWSCGGAMAAVPDEDAAFTGRSGLYWAAAEIQWDDPDLDGECRAWSRAALTEAQPYEAAGRYVNDVSDMVDVRAIYGDAKHDRLVALKRAWDPDNVFRLNQNIRV